MISINKSLYAKMNELKPHEGWHLTLSVHSWWVSISRHLLYVRSMCSYDEQHLNTQRKTSMTTPIKFDKRLQDKNFKSGELSRDELTAYLDELPDLSEDFRYRTTDEETEEGQTGGEGEAGIQAESEGDAGASDE